MNDPFDPPLDPLSITLPPQRTQMVCLGCGCFSSARYCHHCATQPLRVQLLLQVLDCAHLHVEMAPLTPDHPLAVAVRDYYLRCRGD